MPFLDHPWFAGNKPQNANDSSDMTSIKAKQDAKEARKSTSDAVSNAAR